jgi:hypothetical protein
MHPISRRNVDQMWTKLGRTPLTVERADRGDLTNVKLTDATLMECCPRRSELALCRETRQLPGGTMRD